MQRVLLIGKDPQMCRSIAGTLSGLGFRIDVVGERQTGLFLANRREYTHLVVDDNIDDGGGVELLEQLRATSRQITGILLVAAGDLNTFVAALKAGARRILVKPIDYQLLISIISAPKASQTSMPVPRTNERSIARLSLREIQESLSIDQLVSIIRSVDYPFAGKERLEHFDRDTLERVVHLVCRWCRQKAAA